MEFSLRKEPSVDSGQISETLLSKNKGPSIPEESNSSITDQTSESEDLQEKDDIFAKCKPILDIERFLKLDLETIETPVIIFIMDKGLNLKLPMDKLLLADYEQKLDLYEYKFAGRNS